MSQSETGNNHSKISTELSSDKRSLDTAQQEKVIDLTDLAEQAQSLDLEDPQRQRKIEHIKKLISKGQYNPDQKDVAEALLKNL